MNTPTNQSEQEELREQILSHPRVATTNYPDIPNYQQVISIPLQDLMQLILAHDEATAKEAWDSGYQAGWKARKDNHGELSLSEKSKEEASDQAGS